MVACDRSVTPTILTTLSAAARVVAALWSLTRYESLPHTNQVVTLVVAEATVAAARSRAAPRVVAADTSTLVELKVLLVDEAAKVMVSPAVKSVMMVFTREPARSAAAVAPAPAVTFDTAAPTLKLSAPAPPVTVAPLAPRVKVSAAVPPLMVRTLFRCRALVSVIDTLPVAAEASIEVSLTAPEATVWPIDTSRFFAPVTTIDLAASSCRVTLFQVLALPPEIRLMVSMLAIATVPAVMLALEGADELEEAV